MGRALLEVTAVATEADFGKSLAGIGKTAGGLIDARQAEKAKNEELDRPGVSNPGVESVLSYSIFLNESNWKTAACRTLC